MSDYDGLDLSQLLDLMHGLVMPEPIAWTPATPGWWIVSAWLLAVALLIALQIVRYRRRTRYRRQALAELKVIRASADAEPEKTAQQVALLLKRTALVAYPREQVAALYGADWARFLCQSASNDLRISQAASALAGAAYQPGTDGRLLLEPARRWISLHRA